MKVVEYLHKEHKGLRFIDIKGNEVSIVHGPIGVIRLPNCSKPEKISIVFTDEGDYEIQYDSGKFILGTKEYSVIKTLPGKENFNTHMELVYSKRRNAWVVLSSGNLIVPDHELPTESEIIDDQKTSYEVPLNSTEIN